MKMSTRLNFRIQNTKLKCSLYSMFILMFIQNFLSYSKLHMPAGLPDGMTQYGTWNHKHPCACQVGQHYAESR